MKIVIKIPDKIYKFVQNTSFVENESTLFKQTSNERQKTLFLFDILEVIRNGTPLKEWLSTFNTDSATECFTAVQRLKESLNDRLDEGYKG